MAKRKPVAKADVETVETATAPMAAASATAASPNAPEAQQTRGETTDQPPAFAPDPDSKISVSLSKHRGGPSMHLLRSHRFNQMQIRFDGEQPDEKYLAMLTQAGWKDRTEAEGVFTKQIDRNRRWQSVQQMELEFREVANAIRQSRGLAPTLEAMR